MENAGRFLTCCKRMWISSLDFFYPLPPNLSAKIPPDYFVCAYFIYYVQYSFLNFSVILFRKFFNPIITECITFGRISRKLYRDVRVCENVNLIERRMTTRQSAETRRKIITIHRHTSRKSGKRIDPFQRLRVQYFSGDLLGSVVTTTADSSLDRR